MNDSIIRIQQKSRHDKNLLKWLNAISTFVRCNKWTSRLIPQQARDFLSRRCCTIEYVQYLNLHEANKLNIPPHSDYESAHPWMIGVIKDVYNNHIPYIKACREMNIAYRTIDLFQTNWVSEIRSSKCDAYVVWPSESIAEWKRLYDDRLRFLVEHLNKIIYPPYEGLWIYGSKERMRDWLDIHGFPYPKTWVFYDRDEALTFIQSAKFPLVIKLDISGTASGVWIVESIREAQQYVKRVFSAGLSGRRGDARARQWRHILIQEFIPDVREWRMIRIGDTYHGHEKLRNGQFHSGSGKVGWFAPPRKALDLIHAITEAGGFPSMNIDMFETSDGEFLVNELQAVFGATFPAQTYIDGVPGYYMRIDGDYVFHEGCCCQNYLCNLRMKDLLSQLKKKHF